MITIKTKTIKLVPVNIVVYILLAIIIIFFGLTLAHMMQMTKLSHEVAAIKAKQERLMAQNEGQALFKEGADMITYFKIPPESLFPGDYKPKGIKVKSIVFRDDADACRIDCISLDRFGKFVCYEQWSIPDNKKDYKESLKELRSFAGRPMADGDGAGIFAEYERQQEKERSECSIYEKLSMLF